MKAPSYFSQRHVQVIGGVLLLHALALWALQSGLLQRTVEKMETLVAVQVLPDVAQPARVQPRPPAALPQHSTTNTATPADPPPVQATPQPLLSSNAPEAQSQTQRIETAPPVLASVQSMAAPTTPVSANTAANAASAKIELPSSEADYLHNPKAPYPLLSQRRNEQGRVLVEVLIGVDGTAQRAQIKESSGYPRLDQQALATVLSWRYVPGKRGGVPQPMTYTVPINFVLE